jgi:hypothetical protein
MDKDNIVTYVCKDSVSVCYTVKCNNIATKSLKIPLNGIVGCLVYVCDSCLSKYLQSKAGESTETDKHVQFNGDASHHATQEEDDDN